MLGDISVSATGLTASLSIATGYLGTLINFSRLRNRQRRVYGLSLLAEIKSLQRVFRRYYNMLGGDAAAGEPCEWPRLHFSPADTSVFSNGSGNIGLFSTRTAVEVVEYYGAARATAAEAERLLALRLDPQTDHAKLRHDLARHLVSIRLTRHRNRNLVRLLRREIPGTPGARLRQGVRAFMVRLRRPRRNRTARPGARQDALASVRPAVAQGSDDWSVPVSGEDRALPVQPRPHACANWQLHAWTFRQSIGQHGHLPPCR
jgi:hypothetical protein